MNKLKCPKCGNVFTVDESDYAALLSQVKNNEFETELKRRIDELEKTQMARLQAEKNAEQIRQENERMRIEQANNLALHQKEAIIVQMQAEINLLKQKIDGFELVKAAAIQAAVIDKEKQINMLESNQQLANQQKVLEINQVKEDYETKLRAAKETVEFYKDLKARMSTKMVGETLEQHCAAEFETIRPYLPNAYFEKDNDVTNGSKGDFIFRMKTEDDIETVSIMFEMKNETDDVTSKKKHNTDHLAKLDKDRTDKKCEYAVLVSLLEPDNELYNRGIVDMSHAYPKMYVIRPQFFVPLITLLVNESKKSIEYKQQLILAQSQQMDVTNFEAKLLAFQDKFGKHVQSAHTNYDAAIKSIDASIKNLEAVKKSLTTSANQLRLANNDVLDLSIRKLTYGNPTMKAKFDELRQDNEKE